MEERKILVMLADGTEKETLTLVGKESAKSTAFVTEYETYENHGFEKTAYGSISPDNAFVRGFISADVAADAEKNELKVFIKYTQDAIDEDFVMETIGFCKEDF